MFKFKVGLLYYIRFDDHALYDKNLADSQVVGWVVEDHPKKVVLTWWKIIHSDKETVKRNYETVVLAKSTIKEKKVLKVP